MDSIKIEIVVVGAGPGGYAAAFYAADLGKKVILVEKDKMLGGVCKRLQRPNERSRRPPPERADGDAEEQNRGDERPDAEDGRTGPARWRLGWATCLAGPTGF